jgi:hypothetical protein
VKSASQKPYLPSLGAGSQRRRFWRPARPVLGARERLGWSLGDDDAIVSRSKTLVVDLIRFWRGRWSAYIVRETDLVKRNHE